MNPSPEILNELKAISSLLAGLEKINVFRVPEGYFNELHLRIADYAILNNTSPVDNINKRNLQQVPPGYFDTLSDSILAKVKATYPESAEEELRRLSPMLYALKDYNVFSVPDGYFESFTTGIMERLKPQPANPESAEEELCRLSPMLSGLKGNVFSVPDGYFESFAGDVVERLKPQPAKIITMKKGNSWWKYAAAAVVAGAIAVSSLQIFNGSPDMNTGKSGLPDYVQASFQYKTEDDLNAGIAKLSDDDIIKYLEKNGNIMDNELLTNNTDVSEMPSETDYLTDENTLNTYLDKINAETTDKSKP
jgi:hypothetical protein